MTPGKKQGTSFLISLLAGVAILLFPSFSLSQTCTASFLAINNGNGNYTFSNTSVPQSSFANAVWQVPGGSPSVAIGNTVAVTYTANGAYTVNLTYSTSSGSCSNTAVVNVTGAICPLSAGFTWTASGGLVNFINLSTGATTYTWSLGNGISFTPSPVANYTASGVYLISLTASNGTCSNTYTQNISVTIPPCNLSVSVTATMGTFGQVQLTNSSTGTVAGTTYTINYGNGITSNSFQPSHTYTSNGFYVIKVYGSNNSNPPCVGFDSIGVAVTNVTCQASFSVTSNSGGLVNVVSNSSPTFSGSTYVWDYGLPGPTFTLNSIPTHSFQYTSNGFYAITFTFSPGPGCQDVDTQYVAISGAPCPVAASFNYQHGNGGTVTFNNTSTGSGLNSSVPAWDFGDGSTSGLLHPVHSFTANGIYTVSLTMQNTVMPCTSMYVDTVVVTNFTCNAKAIITHTVQSGGFVVFSNPSAIPGPSNVYRWNFGDGNIADGITVTHKYQNGGTHFVQHFAGTGPGCSDNLVQAINVTGVACTAFAGFSLTPLSAGNSFSVIPVYPWNIAAANWTWGDGSGSAGLHSSHAYQQGGNFTICLTVTASCGSTATACSSVVLPAGTTLTVSDPAVTGFSEHSADSYPLEIFPNPCAGFFTIRAGDAGRLSEVILFDGMLRVIQRMAPGPDSEGDFTVDTQTLSPGIFFVQVRINGQTVTRKIIVQ